MVRLDRLGSAKEVGQVGVGRVLHERVREQVGRIRRHALPEQQTSHNETLLRDHHMRKSRPEIADFRFQIKERNTRRRQMSRPLGRNLLCVPSVF